jgi:chromosome segregation ATPase
MPFDRDPEENSLTTLRKDCLAFLAKTQEETARAMEAKEASIEATEKELRLMNHIRESMEKSYKSSEESRDRFKTELRVLEAKMRAFKYEEDTLREFVE